MHSRNPSVIALARALGRTPGSVAMKLVNFASLDPVHQARGISGLRSVSRADREVWQEFNSDWPRMTTESETVLEDLLGTATKEPRSAEVYLPAANQPTERTASVQVRVMQSFFRKAVLAAYGGQCCVTGNPIPQLLVASHILPWAKFVEERINPSNGLCFAAHFDRAFDCGFITFDESLRLVLGSELRSRRGNNAVAREFISMEGASLKLPERFLPNRDFLAYHREKTFER
jgi:putative restriction endonuclease